MLHQYFVRKYIYERMNKLIKKSYVSLCLGVFYKENHLPAFVCVCIHIHVYMYVSVYVRCMHTRTHIYMYLPLSLSPLSLLYKIWIYIGNRELFPEHNPYISFSLNWCKHYKFKKVFIFYIHIEFQSVLISIVIVFSCLILSIVGCQCIVTFNKRKKTTFFPLIIFLCLSYIVAIWRFSFLFLGLAAFRTN